jgi:hypothetical protein
MIYLKSLVFGIAGAVVASVLWIMIVFVLPVFAPYVIGRLRGTGGASTGYVSSGSVLIAALIGFLLAFAWEWHRLRSA